MSKADKLGAGRFGGSQVQGVSARRQAVAAATGVPTEGIAPPTKLSVSKISLNPDNPRSQLGDLTDLAGSLRDHGQKQAITVMNRDAYVEANPGREADLESDTTHVVVDGSCRLSAAREAGLTELKVMVDDEQGSNEEDLLESALVANIHRQDLEPLDEAKALERLLGIHGSQTALATRLHRSQGWVSQRLALLNLAPELRERIGQEPIDLLRAVGNKPTERQGEALEELKARRVEKEKHRDRKASKPHKPEPRPEHAADSETKGHYDVIDGEANQHVAAPEEPRGDLGALRGGEASSQSLRKTRPDADSAAVAAMPWNDPQAIVRIAQEHMTDEDFRTAAKLWWQQALNN